MDYGCINKHFYEAIQGFRWRHASFRITNNWFCNAALFIGTGAVIASALSYMMTIWFGISNVVPEGEIQALVKFSFYIGAIVFFLAVARTVFSTKEYSPKEQKKFSESDDRQKLNLRSQISEIISANKFLKDGTLLLLLRILITIVISVSIKEIDYGLYVLFVGSAAFRIMQFIAGLLTKKIKLKMASL